MHKGLLITIEGGEGAGKSTQITHLQDKLVAAGKDVVSLREPGGTVISEQIREVVLSTKNTGMAYTTEVLLFQAARSQIYSELVLPALEAGKIVLIDRSRDSSVVYQGMVRGFGKDLIEQLNNISTKETYPDLTLLLDVDVKIGLKRREDSGKADRLDLEDSTFHDKIREAYLQLAQENSHNRWKIIDANKTVEEVGQAMWQVVSEKISA